MGLKGVEQKELREVLVTSWTKFSPAVVRRTSLIIIIDRETEREQEKKKERKKKDRVKDENERNLLHYILN